MSNLTAYSPYFVEEEDEDDDVDQILKGDPRSKDSKLATERLNFVALCDAFPLMDPHNLLDAYYTCDRDLEQSIDFVREMTDVEAAHLGITSETKVDYSTILCSFFDLNKFCSYGCPYYHDYLGVRCPYYDPEHKVCPYGADCIFLHTTEEEQRRRLDALQKKHEAANPEEEEEEEEDSSDTFDNTYFVAPHVVDFTQEQEDYLYELYAEFETVPTVIINAILHFM